MIAYRLERVENAICFFAREHKKHAKRLPTQTMMYKYLAFFEFGMLEKTGQPPLGLKYRAMKRGPVPIDIYNRRDENTSELFKFIDRGEGRYDVSALKTPDMEYFSENEIQKMNELIFIFATPRTYTNHFSDASHEKIRAWKEAWERQHNSIIKFEDTFSDIGLKTEEELTLPEENFIIYSMLNECI
jgi:uncharacterized phage-associated protein